MAVTEHLQELRKRIIIALSSIIIASVIAYGKIMYLIEIMMEPLGDFKYELVFTSITEGFITRFKMSVFVSILVMSPIIFYQVIAFIAPGLTKKEKRMLYFSIFFLSLFFILGTLFGYIVLLPYVLNFLMFYSESYLTPFLSGSMYLGFIGVFCLIIGVIFIIPLMLIVLGKVGLITSKNLRKSRKFIILGMAAIELSFIPSTDLLTFIIVVMPIIILYELSVWCIYFIEKRRNLRVIRTGGR